MTRDLQAIIRDAFAVYGHRHNDEQSIEEAAELQVAIQHNKRGRVKRDAVMEEYVDTYLCALIGREECPEAFDRILEAKVDRLRERIAETRQREVEMRMAAEMMSPIVFSIEDLKRMGIDHG
jgi:hypothetical protein